MASPFELIAPAGNMECARAAVANGANAVYFGMPRFNARMRADNFTEAELPELVRFLHSHNVRAFVTFNTLIFSGELADAEKQLILLDEAGVDVVIVQDLGLARLAQKLGTRLAVHASTQMTLTSPEGVHFASELGIKRVVLGRELSMRDLAKFGRTETADGVTNPADNSMPLEVFVHGALCVAYSGQCLTSEALGQRSANRGECAQACRLPYQLMVDGAIKDLGDRRYLLSPQDLAAIREIPELIRLGITGFKIEGRLKTPEYVAATTQVYRKAIDAALAAASSHIGRAGAPPPPHLLSAPNGGHGVPALPESSLPPRSTPQPDEKDWYKLEMTFSRGLYSGWLNGVNHQELVHARFGKKRGPFVGLIERVGSDHVQVQTQTSLQPGDGVVFDVGGDTDQEQGGYIYEIKNSMLFFKHGHINFAQLKPGHRVWKTSDPQLTRELRKSFEGELPAPGAPLNFAVRGTVGQPLMLEAIFADRSFQILSEMPLQAAQKRPLTEETLREQLGRLGDTPFTLGVIQNELEGEVILPIKELNRMRREIVSQVAVELEKLRREEGLRASPLKPVLSQLLEEISTCRARGSRAATADETGRPTTPVAQLVVLCRTMDQITAALEEGSRILHVDFEDIRRYQDAVAKARAHAGVEIYLATPRIQKAGEQGFFKLIEAAAPDGVLIRNLGALDYFRESTLKRIGDFSLNVANPLTAELLIARGLERVTISYDLNASQVLDLLRGAPPSWFELTIHQHMPMFHMEHCVFAAFLSTGTDHTNCGRPCDTHDVRLKDRVGMAHPLKADVGCRNTVFQSRAQSGADYVRAFREVGARHFRVELLLESAEETHTVIRSYRELLEGTLQDPLILIERLRAVKQLGVTQGTLTVL